jgi:oxaloacetate decarboxylase (Na+ extruding) subunit gamma
MILAGIKLMLVGMTTVVLFLTLTIMLILLVAKYTRGFAERELAEIENEKKRRAMIHKAEDEVDADEDIVVIAAAVAAFEAEKLARS